MILEEAHAELGLLLNVECSCDLIPEQNHSILFVDNNDAFTALIEEVLVALEQYLCLDVEHANHVIQQFNQHGDDKRHE